MKETIFINKSLELNPLFGSKRKADLRLQSVCLAFDLNFERIRGFFNTESTGYFAEVDAFSNTVAYYSEKILANPEIVYFCLNTYGNPLILEKVIDRFITTYETPSQAFMYFREICQTILRKEAPCKSFRSRKALDILTKLAKFDAYEDKAKYIFSNYLFLYVTATKILVFKRPSIDALD